MAKCPRCGRKGKEISPGLFDCPAGHGCFDNDPDEGGTHGNDPSKRLEREDERAKQQPRKEQRR